MSARFKLDENLPRDAETLLREAGHDVHTALAEHLGGNLDPRVFHASQAEDRILVTFDLDFSDIRLYPPARADARKRALARAGDRGTLGVKFSTEIQR